MSQDALAEELAVRRCYRCKEIKPLTDFPERTKGWCHPCKRTYARALYAKNLHENRAKMYDDLMQRRYGLTPSERDAMWEAQGQGCAICGRHVDPSKERRIQVDHCHTTGKVRGLLCAGCNRMLSGAKDSVEILEKGIAYLREH